MLKIVHFSLSPIAGAPIRLIQALRTYTDFQVHLIDFKRWNIFEHDIIFSENPDYALSIAEQANIIHFHNNLNFTSKEFYPIDFKKIKNKGTLFIRQFHSPRAFISKSLGISENELLLSSIPSIVIAQYHERYFPSSKVVPNIIPQNSPLYLPQRNEQKEEICFTPSNNIGAWDGLDDSIKRWANKGAFETIDIINKISKKTRCHVKILTGQSLVKVMRSKQRATIVLDDMVTGSYHLSGLEGLSVGKPVLAFLDNRTLYTLKEISGSSICPFVNVRLEDAYEVMLYLLQHPDEARGIGQFSRQWIEQYWSDKLLVQHYVDVYTQLLNDPTQIKRQDSLRFDSHVVSFHSVILPDLIYRSRAKRFRPIPFSIKNIRQQFRKLLILMTIRLPRYLRRIFN